MIIAARSQNHHKPIIFLDTRRQDQIVIRFLSRDEHITIHQQPDGKLLKTHYFPDKPSSVWDEQRVETAKSMGIVDPERHGNYADHQILSIVSNLPSYDLVGRRVDLSILQPRQRYYNQIAGTLNVGSDNFMLKIYLSTPQNTHITAGISTTTILGDVCFEEEV
ncbi:MAG TPA: hypothetical protein ACFYEK_17440 [Candidatus Wunengus sp. YC60]|uniref:hypothetical protein n=1 Tax=Candidatus Wunengus sp. YC60 TaxID=3367697 RepID=UPI00402806AA